RLDEVRLAEDQVAVIGNFERDEMEVEHRRYWNTSPTGRTVMSSSFSPSGYFSTILSSAVIDSGLGELYFIGDASGLTSCFLKSSPFFVITAMTAWSGWMYCLITRFTSASVSLASSVLR